MTGLMIGESAEDRTPIANRSGGSIQLSAALQWYSES
jgi:hypothetical protein